MFFSEERSGQNSEQRAADKELRCTMPQYGQALAAWRRITWISEDGWVRVKWIFLTYNIYTEW